MSTITTNDNLDLAPRLGDRVEDERIALRGTRCVAAVLRLNRPDALNALDRAMIEELGVRLRAADADPAVAAILVTGRGRSFSAGGDLKAYIELQQDAVAFAAFIDVLGDVFGSIPYLSKPVVALVNGIAAAGGVELLLACDFAFAARSSRIGDAHLNYGQIGGGGSLALLPRTIGPARARELVFSARFLEADEALAWGLVNRVLDDADLLEAGLDFARGVAEKSPAAVAHAKYAMNAGWADGTGLPAALRLERDRAALYCTTLPDSAEGLRAFSEKRAPRFPGR
jgi:enoyl-CoA hydratase/carnithine racemase